MRKIISKLLPNQEVLKNHLGNSSYANSILQSDCFHINRRSISKAVAIGLFFAFIPLPLQMALAATTAIFFRANFIVAIMMTWITNPITFVPFNYLIFSVGHYVTRNEEVFHSVPAFDFDNFFSLSLFSHYTAWLKQAGISFIVGIPIVATMFSVIGYIVIEIVWRVYLYRSIIKRKKVTKN